MPRHAACKRKLLPPATGIASLVFLLWTASCCWFFTPAVLAGDSPGPKQIILTWTGDPLETQTITWLTPDNTPARVQYLSHDEFTGSFAAALEVSAGCSVFDSINYRCTANLTDLKPGTKYVYRAGNDGAWSEVLSFTTARDTREFTFLYMGDVQAGYTQWGETLDSVYRTHPKIKFALLGGDLTDNGSDAGEWGQFLDAATGVFSFIPVQPALGNHDGNMYMNFFALPQNGPAGLEQEFYSFDYGNAHFVVLDSGNNTNERAIEWLREDLGGTTKEWKFAVFHKPAYPATYDYKEIDKSIRANWIPILEQNRVDMVFVGHQHVYMRTHPIYQDEIQTDPAAYGIVYVMGNAGSKMYAKGGGFPYIAMEQSGSNYQIIEIKDGLLTLTAREATGELIETYTINKGDPSSSEPAYTLTPGPDYAYTPGITAGGVITFTVNAGVAGFKYFTVGVTPVVPRGGKEVVVFSHLRNGSQLGINAARADFDQVYAAQAGFDVRQGDLIKVFMVDHLTSDTSINPVILQ
ncbi:MAG: Alkaline phosphatase precursor [Firmicutes bacterium ADurb.Bin456]|nr:MAG: Alkaline phosphatase precursor [Firmicutes bacterium ADurb.Bin456]